MQPSDLLARLAADASHAATTAESSSGVAALNQAATIWGQIRQGWMTGAYAEDDTEWKVGELLHQADMLAADGNPEHTAMADEVWDLMFRPVADDRYGHCSGCSEDNPANDGDGYTLCCNEPVCTGDGGAEWGCC